MSTTTLEQAGQEYQDAIQRHETIHARWMNTNVFTAEGARLKRELHDAGVKLSIAQDRWQKVRKNNS